MKTSITYTGTDGKKIVVPTSHPAHLPMKQAVASGAPMVVMAFATIGFTFLGMLAGAISGQWGWVLYGLVCLLPIKKLSGSPRITNLLLAVLGGYLVYRWGFGFVAFCTFAVPTVGVLLMRRRGKALKANADKVAAIIKEHPLPTA